MEKHLIEQTIKYYKTLSKLDEEGLYRSRPLLALTKDEWREILDQLGFNPGSFISQLYLSVGGGFIGPGYGTLRADTVDEAFSLVGYYLAQRSENKRNSSWFWPQGLLGLIDWGCTIVSCIDCTTDKLEVIRFDPNSRSERPRDWSKCFRAEAETLYDWWKRWLEGEDLWIGTGSAFPRWDRYHEVVPIERKMRRKRRDRITPDQLALDFDIK